MECALGTRPVSHLKGENMRVSSLLCAAVAALSGCAAPQFDVPPGSDGRPTVQSIVQRITCELVALTKPSYVHHMAFLAGHYEVAVALKLEVSDTGELGPNLKFPAGNTFSSNVGFKLGQKRTHVFNEKLLFSIDKLQREAAASTSVKQCPTNPKTKLAGELGIETLVTLAMTSTSSIAPLRLLDASAGGAFGGSIEFVVTRNVNALGVTWTLGSFVGPGNMGLLQRVNTDSVTLAFVAGKPSPLPNAEASKRAEDFLGLLLQQAERD